MLKMYFIQPVEVFADIQENYIYTIFWFLSNYRQTVI